MCKGWQWFSVWYCLKNFTNRLNVLMKKTKAQKNSYFDWSWKDEINFRPDIWNQREILSFFDRPHIPNRWEYFFVHFSRSSCSINFFIPWHRLTTYQNDMKFSAKSKIYHREHFLMRPENGNPWKLMIWPIFIFDDLKINSRSNIQNHRKIAFFFDGSHVR